MDENSHPMAHLRSPGMTNTALVLGALTATAWSCPPFGWGHRDFPLIGFARGFVAIRRWRSGVNRKELRSCNRHMDLCCRRVRWGEHPLFAGRRMVSSSPGMMRAQRQFSSLQTQTAACSKGIAWRPCRDDAHNSAQATGAPPLDRAGSFALF